MIERTDAYQFTTTDLNDPRINELKANVAFNNRLSREATRGWNHSKIVHALWRVRLMPRGARTEAAWGDYRSRRAYDSYLPQRHGDRFDVYLHRDSTAEWMMQREIDTGLTQGQLKRLDRERDELRKQEWEMHSRLRDAGMYTVEGEYVSREVAIKHDRDIGLPEHWIERKYK